jgi:hypothetical protein
MTNKSLEALEELCSRCYVDSEKCSCHARYKGGECSTSCEYKELLEKDLERLDKLEKAIDILKNKLHIEFDDKYNEINFKVYACKEIDYVYFSLDDKQQYELLKEVLKNYGCNLLDKLK